MGTDGNGIKFFVIAALLISAGLSADPPKEGYAIGPTISADVGCLKDLLKAEQLEGLARRKMFAELIQYGCIVRLSGIFHLTVLEIKNVLVMGEAGGVKAYLVSTDLALRSSGGKPEPSHTGLVREREFMNITAEEMSSYYEAHKAELELLRR